MIRVLTKEEEEKLKFIDTLFIAIPSEELAQMVEQEEIVAILKNKPISSGIFHSLYTDNRNLCNQITKLECELINVRRSIRELMDVMEKGTFNSGAQADFHNLKARTWY